jgi:hypothetical protein
MLENAFYENENLILKVGVGESIVNAPRVTDHGSAV